MSEADKAAEAEVITATSGTGPLEHTRGEHVAGKSEEKANGVKPVEEQTKRRDVKKEGDVKMEDAGDNKGMGEEENKLSKEVEEEEPLKEEVAEEANKEHKKKEAVEENGEEAMKKGEGVEEKGYKGEEKTKEIEETGTMKRRAKQRSGHESGEKYEKVEKKKGRKAKDISGSPVTFSIDRPVRERKTVERLVETLQKEPSKALLIEKGQGTPLKDIPNVAYKLSKKRPDDIRSLHDLLFGRKGKAAQFKSHIFQFSGFVWHDNEEKQRAKVKEKLDKCVKDKLLDFCDVFDIPVSRATLRKEDLVEKLLDFMVSPHATTNVILAEKEQSSKSTKHRTASRGKASRTAGTPRKQSRKKRTKGEDTLKSEESPNDTEDEDGDGDENGREEDNEAGLPDQDEAIKHSENDGNESEHDDSEEEYSHKGRQDPKRSSNRQGSSVKASKKATTPDKAPPTAAKSPSKTSSKRKADEDKNTNEKTFLKKKKEDVTPKNKMPSLKPHLKEKRSIGKKSGRGKAKSDQAAESGPSEEELRKTICEILKEVDFNTATFTDILKKLTSHCNMDLTARKASVKLMIQDELTKLADEAPDQDNDNDDKSEDGNPEPVGKKVGA